MNKHLSREPEFIPRPDPKRPEIDPMPEGPSTADIVTASKKVDDISRHESHYDPKLAPKPTQEHPPKGDERQGGKPMPGPVKPAQGK